MVGLQFITNGLRFYAFITSMFLALSINDTSKFSVWFYAKSKCSGFWVTMINDHIITSQQSWPNCPEQLSVARTKYERACINLSHSSVGIKHVVVYSNRRHDPQPNHITITTGLLGLGPPSMVSAVSVNEIFYLSFNINWGHGQFLIHG